MKDEIDDWVNRLIEGDEAFRLRKENELLAAYAPESCSLHMLLIENDIAQREAARRFRESRSEEANQLLKEILELKEEIERKVNVSGDCPMTGRQTPAMPASGSAVR